jgi:hypothetical protein
MTYQSPLHILDSLHITPDELTPEGITRLRKKLLAEFSLTSDITIDVNGQSYTKDEILKVIDQLKEVDNLVLHKAIFSRKPLLDWLENPQKSVFPQDLAQEVLDENLESDFYQKTLQFSLANYVKFHFKKRHFIQLQKTVPFIANLQEEYRYDVYDVIYDEIQVIIDEIEYAQQNPNVRENKERFGFISEPQWTDFLNNLPENFEGIREAYCYAAVNYTVVIQRKDKEWTYEISSQLDQTLCEGSIRETIKSNHYIYTNNYHGTTLEEKSKPWTGWFWLIFILIRLLYSSNSCSNNSSSSNSYSVPPTYDTYSSPEPPPAPPEEIAPDASSRIENIEKEYGQIKLPANTFYIMQIQNYQKALVKNNYPHEGQRISVMKGANVLENLNLGNTEEHIDTKNRVNPQMITFNNLTDYDLVIFKAGCNANRSFFINSKDTYWIETCSGDVFHFYFGKNWLQNYPNSSGMDEKKRFQGYFSVSHKNTNAIFMKEYSFGQGMGTPTVTFDNGAIEKNIMPTATGLNIKEYDTSIILR